MPRVRAPSLLGRRGGPIQGVNGYVVTVDDLEVGGVAVEEEQRRPAHPEHESESERRSMRQSGRPALYLPTPHQRVWIIGRGENETNCDLAEEWGAHGVTVRMIRPDEAPSLLAEGDVAISRIDVRRSVDGVEPGLLALLDLSRRGVRVVNRPSAILAAHDKLRTARALAARGLPHPRTAHLVPGEPVPLAPPFVVKPRFGSWGTDIFRCLTGQDVERVLEVLSSRLWFQRQGAVVQEFLPNAGQDLRMLVASRRVVGADQRVAREGEWRTNVSLGAAELPAHPSPEAEALAVAAVDALGGDLFGVDLLPVPANGLFVLEVNAAVEFDHMYSLGRRDVYVDVAVALDLLRLALPHGAPIARARH
jgi:RimK family alpha-L-glutamate ligase